MRCEQLGCVYQARFRITVKIDGKKYDRLLCYTHYENCVKQWADIDGRLRTVLSRNIFGELCNYEIVTVWDLENVCYKLEKNGGAQVPIESRIRV